jgi:hypothetical protein
VWTGLHDDFAVDGKHFERVLVDALQLIGVNVYPPEDQCNCG